jgi:hypothetical protein
MDTVGKRKIYFPVPRIEPHNAGVRNKMEKKDGSSGAETGLEAQF